MLLVLRNFREFSISPITYKKGDIYNKLWASATGGMRPGRRQKKITIFPVKEEILGFNKEKATFFGLNKPIGYKKDSVEAENIPSFRKNPQSSSSLKILKPWKISNSSDDNFTVDKNDKSSIDLISKQKRTRASLAVKGWSGTSFCGRYAGPPINSKDGQHLNLESIIVNLKKVKIMKSSGKSRIFRAAVVVGNRKGLVGWSDATANSGISAIRKARNNAANYLNSVSICDNHTIFHDSLIKFNRTELSFEKKPKNYGLKCQRVIKAVCQLAGILDIRVVLRGNNNPITLCKATIEGLSRQETHEDLAERTGMFVVEYRPEIGGNDLELPKVISIPSSHSIERRNAAIKSNPNYLDEEIYNNSLDPYNGLHRTTDLKLYKQYKS